MKRVTPMTLCIGLVIVAACSRVIVAPPTTTTTDPTASTTTTTTTTTQPTGTTGPTTTTTPTDPTNLFEIDWWSCWLAQDAQDQGGNTPGNGASVARLPNCASGPSSVGVAGDMSGSVAPPIFRAQGAAGHPSIEFTFAGDTLLQTNDGLPWAQNSVLQGSDQGVTLAWIGMANDVNSHNVKYLVSGLSSADEYPMLMVEGEGLNRFAGYGGGNIEARSSDGTVVDETIHGVILHLAPGGSASVVEVDATDVTAGQDSAMQTDVAGLTLGNHFSRGFSTTDHQFVFLGLYSGPLSESQKAAFWEYVAGL